MATEYSIVWRNHTPLYKILTLFLIFLCYNSSEYSISLWDGPIAFLSYIITMQSFKESVDINKDMFYKVFVFSPPATASLS